MNIDIEEWDEPTHEPMNVTTGVFNELGYHGFCDFTRHRLDPRANSYARDKARR